MEFPVEIVAIIKAYSMPRFKYFREYKRVMRLCGMVSWPLLKEKLMSKGDTLLPYLLAYQDALVEWHKVAGQPMLYWGDARVTLDEWCKAKRRARTSALKALVHTMG